MDAPDHVVFVVDDEAEVRASIADLLKSLRFNPVPLSCAADYLALGRRPTCPACIVLDIHLPDLSGLELQAELAGRNHPPIVFLTGRGDIPSSVSAMKQGAVDFLTKPFNDVDLMGAVREALKVDAIRLRERRELDILEERYQHLTPREREVLPLIVGGMLNKQAAALLGISEVTLQIHRGRIMQKMQATSLADLVRIAEKLHIPITFSRYGGVPSHEATVNGGRYCR